MGDAPLIKMCQYCQKEQGLIDIVRKYNVNVSHSVCKRHFIEQIKAAHLSPEKEALYIKGYKGTNAGPDLKDYPELVKQYRQGIFQEPLAESLVKRFKKLAGIKR